MATERDDAELVALLEAARAAGPKPADDLRARVIADAVRVARHRGLAAKGAASGRRRGWFAAIWDAVGGWQGGAGLAAATVAGLAIGFGAPGALPLPTSGDGDLVEEVAFAVWLWPGVDVVIDTPLANEEG
jgi:hypothetical protein